MSIISEFLKTFFKRGILDGNLEMGLCAPAHSACPPGRSPTRTLRRLTKLSTWTYADAGKERKTLLLN